MSEEYPSVVLLDKIHSISQHAGYLRHKSNAFLEIGMRKMSDDLIWTAQQLELMQEEMKELLWEVCNGDKKKECANQEER